MRQLLQIEMGSKPQLVLSCYSIKLISIHFMLHAKSCIKFPQVNIDIDTIQQDDNAQDTILIWFLLLVFQSVL